MTDLILHHFDASPFAEKIRLVFGVKRLTWHSVEIPMIMPKPELTALTGGYRKTPVLQIGADIYCDTLLIAQELERRHPDPTLFPDGRRALALALGRWSDKAFFEPGAALSMGENPQVPDAVIEDRKAFFNFMDFGELDAALPMARLELQGHFALLNDALDIDTPFLSGILPGWADILAWFPVWMTKANVPSAPELLAPFSRIDAWSKRMAGIGHGKRHEMDAADAIELGRSIEPDDGGEVLHPNPLDLSRGDHVGISADDYGRDEVEGELIHLDYERMTIRRHDERAGELNVHFPLIGYRIRSVP